MTAAQAAENNEVEAGLFHKFQYQKQKHQVERYPPTEHFSNGHNDCPNQHENDHKMCNEKGHSLVNLNKSQS